MVYIYYVNNENKEVEYSSENNAEIFFLFSLNFKNVITMKSDASLKEYLLLFIHMQCSQTISIYIYVYIHR